MNNLFVYCEIEEGIVADVSLELLTKGRSLANQLNCQLEAVVAGTDLKDIEKQIVFQSIIFPVAAGEYTLYLGDLSLGQYELYMYNASVKVVGNFTL